MKANYIQTIKFMRLIISIVILLTVVIYPFMVDYVSLPKEELLMTIWLSIFVFLLGLQYKIEKKNQTQAYFLMLFSIMMLIMAIVGMVYV